jgi:ubiquitin C-terminal hydrolase
MTPEDFMDLGVNFPASVLPPHLAKKKKQPPVALEECLDASYKHAGVLDKRCSVCNNGSGTKISKIGQAPDYLCIQIRRFQRIQYLKGPQIQKSLNGVIFPVDDFDISSWVAGAAPNAEGLDYELYGLVEHKGDR